MKTLCIILATCLLISCSQPSGSSTNSSSDQSAIDLKRANPKQSAIQQYDEKVADDLNNWHFRVALYETGERFTYHMKLQYEEVTGEDDISFPNLGIEPEPVLKKGTKQYECIIGFKDQAGEFREYKKVSVVDGNLKVTTLKSYAVTTK